MPLVDLAAAFPSRQPLFSPVLLPPSNPGDFSLFLLPVWRPFCLPRHPWFSPAFWAPLVVTNRVYQIFFLGRKPVRGVSSSFFPPTPPRRFGCKVGSSSGSSALWWSPLGDRGGVACADLAMLPILSYARLVADLFFFRECTPTLVFELFLLPSPGLRRVFLVGDPRFFFLPTEVWQSAPANFFFIFCFVKSVIDVLPHFSLFLLARFFPRDFFSVTPACEFSVFSPRGREFFFPLSPPNFLTVFFLVSMFFGWCGR